MPYEGGNKKISQSSIVADSQGGITSPRRIELHLSEIPPPSYGIKIICGYFYDYGYGPYR